MGDTSLLLAQLKSADEDDDGVCDNLDNCPGFANPLQEDFENDQVGDSCDNCLSDINPYQDGGDIKDIVTGKQLYIKSGDNFIKAVYGAVIPSSYPTVYTFRNAVEPSLDDYGIPEN